MECSSHRVNRNNDRTGSARTEILDLGLRVRGYTFAQSEGAPHQTPLWQRGLKFLKFLYLFQSKLGGLTLPQRMAKSGKKTISDADKSVLIQLHHVLKWKGLTASAELLAKEAKLQTQALGSYSPAAASSIYERLSKSEESESDSDSSSSSDEDSVPVKKVANQRKEENV